MTDKAKIRNIIELFIAWNGETEPIDVANIDSAVEFIGSSLQEEPVSTKDKLLALSDGRLHLGWIDDAKVVEFEECLMQFHEDMNNIPQGTDSLTRLKDTDGVLHSYSKKLMSMAKEEPVSEDLEKEMVRYIEQHKSELMGYFDIRRIARHFAYWQKQQMMKNVIEVEVKEDAGGYPYIEPDIELYDYDKDAPTAKAGDKVKLIIIKED